MLSFLIVTCVLLCLAVPVAFYAGAKFGGNIGTGAHKASLEFAKDALETFKATSLAEKVAVDADRARAAAYAKALEAEKAHEIEVTDVKTGKKRRVAQGNLEPLDPDDLRAHGRDLEQIS